MHDPRTKRTTVASHSNVLIRTFTKAILRGQEMAAEFRTVFQKFNAKELHNCVYKNHTYKKLSLHEI